MIYLVSAIIAEGIALIMYYPLEIFKVKYVGQNDIHKFRGIKDCLSTIYKQEGFKGLYRGYPYFLVNYVFSNNIQIVIYETYMDLKKRKWGIEEFHKNENRYVIEAALIGGVLAGTMMNSFECIMYLKMAELESKKSILQIYRERGLTLFTKGLQTRIMMSSGYAMI